MSRRGFVRGASAVAVAGSVSTMRGLEADVVPEALHSLSMGEASRLIRERKVSSVQLTRAVLDRIDLYNPKVNAYITVMREAALAQAAALDAEAAAGRYAGPLHGIPISLKDNIDTAGTRTTMASAVFDDRVPSRDAFVVERLRKAGAILLGKTNLHEFAMGGSSATSYFGPVRNPWALDRVPSGSSGGSAAAVIADMAYGALGTDTGGSIRMPAAYCSVVGLKPTYGLVSLGGIFPLIYSLDHCGPLTKTVEDAAILLGVLAGYDRNDVASVEHPAEDYVALMRRPVAKLRLGIPRAPFFDHLAPEIALAMDEAIQVLSRLVSGARDVSLPPVSEIPWTSVRSGEVEAVHQEIFRHRGGEYSLQTHRVVAETQKDLNDTATEACSSRVSDYVNASWALTRARRTIDDAFRDVDVIALPTMRVMPRTIDVELGREEDPKPREPEIDANAIAFNVFGLPAISIPCGFSKDGLPIGLTIAGPRFSEGRILALAHAFEGATSWHTMRPRLSPEMAVPAIKTRS